MESLLVTTETLLVLVALLPILPKHRHTRKSRRDEWNATNPYRVGGEDGKGDWEIFVRCPTEFKGKLRANILKAQDRIPTLGTLFEDLKYLEPLASSMELLIDPTAKQTFIYTLFLKIFYGNESKFSRGYRALWLFCMQNFPQLVSSPPRKESKCPRPTVFERKNTHWRVCTAR